MISKQLIGFTRHVRDPETGRTIRIEDVLATVEVEIDEWDLASYLGAIRARIVAELVGGAVPAPAEGGAT